MNRKKTFWQLSLIILVPLTVIAISLIIAMISNVGTFNPAAAKSKQFSFSIIQPAWAQNDVKETTINEEVQETMIVAINEGGMVRVNNLA